MVLVKNLKFFHVFIFVKINQQNVLDVILESKKAFLDYRSFSLSRNKKINWKPSIERSQENDML